MVLQLSEQQIAAFAGGPTLRRLALGYDVPGRDNRRASNRLAAALLQACPLPPPPRKTFPCMGELPGTLLMMPPGELRASPSSLSL